MPQNDSEDPVNPPVGSPDGEIIEPEGQTPDPLPEAPVQAEAPGQPLNSENIESEDLFFTSPNLAAAQSIDKSINNSKASSALSSPSFDEITEEVRQRIIAEQEDYLRKKINEINFLDDDKAREMDIARMISRLEQESLKNSKAKEPIDFPKILSDLNSIEVAGYKSVHSKFKDSFQNVAWVSSGEVEGVKTRNVNIERDGKLILALTETTHNNAPQEVTLSNGKFATINSYRKIEFPTELKEEEKGPAHFSMAVKDGNGKNIAEKEAVYFTAHYDEAGKLTEISSPVPVKFMKIGKDEMCYIERGDKIYTLPLTKQNYERMHMVLKENKLEAKRGQMLTASTPEVGRDEVIAMTNPVEKGRKLAVASLKPETLTANNLEVGEDKIIKIPLEEGRPLAVAGLKPEMLTANNPEVGRDEVIAMTNPVEKGRKLAVASLKPELEVILGNNSPPLENKLVKSDSVGEIKRELTAERAVEMTAPARKLQFATIQEEVMYDIEHAQQPASYSVTTDVSANNPIKEGEKLATAKLEPEKMYDIEHAQQPASYSVITEITPKLEPDNKANNPSSLAKQLADQKEKLKEVKREDIQPKENKQLARIAQEHGGFEGIAPPKKYEYSNPLPGGAEVSAKTKFGDDSWEEDLNNSKPKKVIFSKDLDNKVIEGKGEYQQADHSHKPMGQEANNQRGSKGKPLEQTDTNERQVSNSEVLSPKAEGEANPVPNRKSSKEKTIVNENSPVSAKINHYNGVFASQKAVDRVEALKSNLESQSSTNTGLKNNTRSRAPSASLQSRQDQVGGRS